MFPSKKYVPTTQDHTISEEDRIWERLGEIASRHYEGSRSKAIAGLVIHEWMVEINKRRVGLPHDHWLSAPLVLHPEELEPLMERLIAGDCDYVGSYMEKRIEERLGGLHWSTGSPSQVGGYWWAPDAAGAPDRARAELVITTQSPLGEILHGTLPAAHSGGWWYGPLSAPKFVPPLPPSP